ncbi:fibronectin type III domain-containing protein [Pedobacter sp. WC2423]|uniref:fibronectin type III domain-containing protein n=1 Tax=Pedobacter sp. WC2423 TaxID=3234142 RepID=UPI0034650A68
MSQAPGAPLIGVATAGNVSVSVTFTKPTTIGGSEITGYTVISSPVRISAWGTSSPVVITGLTNGKAYSFTVTASNDSGQGSTSAVSNSVTPIANNVGSDDNYGWSKRIIFIVGGGPSLIANTVYQDVAIDKSTNNVLIEKADKLRTNLSLGILTHHLCLI